MVSIPLITSIPPRMSRLNAKGDQIGEAYQLACIASWKRAGFEPVSVNWKNESFKHELRMIPVNRSASEITGRPHVFFADLLAAASIEARGRPFAIMNADLVLTPTTALAARVAQLRPGELIFTRRIDIDQPGQTDGMTWRYGYDFFASHADDTSGLSDVGMVFGAPWWDHLFPLLMLMRGCRIYQIEPTVLHLKHTERWNWPMWEELGQRFVYAMKASAVDTYRLRLEAAIKGRTDRLLSDLEYNLWKRLPENAAGEARRMLHRVSDMNLSFLDEMSSQSDAGVQSLEDRGGNLSQSG
jgi:hypothetical protein